MGQVGQVGHVQKIINKKEKYFFWQVDIKDIIGQVGKVGHVWKK